MRERKRGKGKRLEGMLDNVINLASAYAYPKC